MVAIDTLPSSQFQKACNVWWNLENRKGKMLLLLIVDGKIALIRYTDSERMPHHCELSIDVTSGRFFRGD